MLVSTPKRVRARQWHSMEVRLSRREAVYFVDGSLFAKVSSIGDDEPWPARGYIGMIRFGTNWKFRKVKITQA